MISRRRLTEEQKRSLEIPVYSTLEIGDDLRVRLSNRRRQGDLTFRPWHVRGRVRPDGSYDWWYHSEMFGISVLSGSNVLLMFEVKRGFVHDCAFPADLSPRQLQAAAGTLSKAGFGGWILPGLRGLLRHESGLGEAMQPLRIVAIAKRILEWEGRGTPSVHLPEQPGRSAAKRRLGRVWLSRQHRYALMRSSGNGQMVLSGRPDRDGLVYRTVYYKGSWDGLWWYDSNSFAVYAEREGVDLFSLHVEHEHVTGAAFDPDLDVRQIRAAADAMRKVSLGRWLPFALRHTIWYLGTRHLPDAPRIGALARLLTEWNRPDARPLNRGARAPITVAGPRIVLR